MKRTRSGGRRYDKAKAGSSTRPIADGKRAKTTERNDDAKPKQKIQSRSCSSKANQVCSRSPPTASKVSATFDGESQENISTAYLDRFLDKHVHAEGSQWRKEHLKVFATLCLENLSDISFTRGRVSNTKSAQSKQAWGKIQDVFGSQCKPCSDKELCTMWNAITYEVKKDIIRRRQMRQSVPNLTHHTGKYLEDLLRVLNNAEDLKGAKVTNRDVYRCGNDTESGKLISRQIHSQSIKDCEKQFSSGVTNRKKIHCSIKRRTDAYVKDLFQDSNVLPSDSTDEDTLGNLSVTAERQVSDVYQRENLVHSTPCGPLPKHLIPKNIGRISEIPKEIQDELGQRILDKTTAIASARMMWLVNEHKLKMDVLNLTREKLLFELEEKSDLPN